MTKKIILHAERLLLLAPCSAVEAQQPKKIPRIGYLSGGGARIEAFRHGLHEIGYVEGKNIIIEWRSADGKPDRVPALAAELVRLKVEVIVALAVQGNPYRQGSDVATTPIVMAQ